MQEIMWCSCRTGTVRTYRQGGGCSLCIQSLSPTLDLCSVSLYVHLQRAKKCKSKLDTVSEFCLDFRNECMALTDELQHVRKAQSHSAATCSNASQSWALESKAAHKVFFSFSFRRVSVDWCCSLQYLYYDQDPVPTFNQQAQDVGVVTCLTLTIPYLPSWILNINCQESK